MAVQGISEKTRIHVPDKLIHTCGECLGTLMNPRVILEILTVDNKHHIELSGYGDCVTCGDEQDSFGWEKQLWRD